MNQYLNTVSSLIKSCYQTGENFLIVILKSLYYRLNGKRIFAHRHCSIRGLSKIIIGNRLDIGLRYQGFSYKSDHTYLNIEGVLRFQSSYSIGRGCRLDVGPNATAVFGSGYMNPNTVLIIMHHLEVGDGTYISWNCQFIDDDFHVIRNSDGTPLLKDSNAIRIGNHVWIGSNVIILKGVTIPNGCVIAAGSVVTKPFTEENSLIAGVPAKVIRKNIVWE